MVHPVFFYFSYHLMSGYHLTLWQQNDTLNVRAAIMRLLIANYIGLSPSAERSGLEQGPVMPKGDRREFTAAAARPAPASLSPRGDRRWL
jgi:hypothetical protein